MGEIGELPRSEVDCVADAVWRLVERRVLRSDAETIRAAATALGISVDDVRVASIRLDRRTYRPPRPRAVEPGRVRDAPVVSGGGRGSRRGEAIGTARLADDGSPECWCARCRTWKPQDEFGIKDHRTGRRKSYCRVCMREYQRERYLSVEKAGHLAELRFRLVDGDATIGESCGVCREILAVGDEVLARGALVHAGCGEGVSP